jgi:uncharacterized protein (DUF1778 family)
MDTKDERTDVLGAIPKRFDVLPDRRAFALDERAWGLFDEALARPPRVVPGLRDLMTRPTVLDSGG